MIYFDVTKAGVARHRSGLRRVSARLADGFGRAAAEVRWQDGRWTTRGGARLDLEASDWLVTSELFSEEERPGFTKFLAAPPCRTAAIFHDAIPLKFPEITWPQSVARHPGYMKLLARFDRVWAVSEASRAELVDFWRWQEVEKLPPVDVLANGADFAGGPRVIARMAAPMASLLCVGILEPRKNQALLLVVATALWEEGLKFEVHLVGRVNPHFGRPLVARIKALRRTYPGLNYHEAADDATVARLYATARASVFPTLAEGCGLPLIESLWMGVPCVCSDLPVLRENADGGGCVPVTMNDREAWRTALRGILTDDAAYGKLVREATTRALPTWAEAAETLRRGLQAGPADATRSH